MKKLKNVAAGIVVIAVLLLSAHLCVTMFMKGTVSQAKDIFLDTEILTKNKQDSGEEFKILEIVSDVSNARIGYLIGGQEPGLNNGALTDSEAQALADSLESEGLLTKDLNSAVLYPLKYGDDVIISESRRDDLESAGYTYVVIDQNGNVVSSPGSVSGNSVSGNSVSGNSVSGNSVSGNSVSGNSVSNNNPGQQLRYKYTKKVFINNELFKRYVFGLDSDFARMNVTVSSKKPGDITVADIEGADLIYWSGLNAQQYISIQDMGSEQAISLLGSVLKKTDGCTPIIMDFNIYETLKAYYDNAMLSNINMYKVATVLLCENPDSVYEEIETQSAFNLNFDTDLTWDAVKNAIVIANGGHFVNQNIYSYLCQDDGYNNTNIPSTGLRTFVNADFVSFYSTNALVNGLESVIEAIDAENYNNSINNSDRPSMSTTNVTSAIVLQYLINYSRQPAIIYKDEIRILEIEPCKDFIFSNYDKKVEMISKWFPSYIDKIEKVKVTCMTISEYIGHNEDITEEYDLVYIGSNQSKFNLSSPVNIDCDGDGTYETSRIYRKYVDDSMNGLLYSHVGDLGNVQYWGLIKTDKSYTEKTAYRYPGNDLTTYKLKELEKYLSSGSPIVVADDFFTYHGTDSVIPNVSDVPTDINGGHQLRTENDVKLYGILDTSSYVYQMVVYALTGQDKYINPDDWTSENSISFSWSDTRAWEKRAFKNFFFASEAEVKNDDLTGYVNQQKLYLNLTSRPTEYTYKTKGKHSYIDADSVTYLAPASDGNYYLNYEFSISSLGVSEGGQTFDCELFIDINNDGKFSGTLEKIDSLQIVDLSTGKQMVESGGTYKLRAGIPYGLTRILPDDYLGCISWMLKCTANNNRDIHTSETGYTVAKEPDAQKQKLKILQVTSGYSSNNNPDGINSNNLNLQNELNSATSMWGELLNNIPDFELDITTICTYGEDGLVKRFKGNQNYLSEFDMLIFGFGDGFVDIRYSRLLDAIEDYANSGKCILFAHDTTFVQTSQLTSLYSYTDLNTEGGKQISWDTDGTIWWGNDDYSRWGDYEADKRPRYLTQYIRRIAGMDTYGVTVPDAGGYNNIVRNGSEISKYSAGDRTKVTDDWNTLLSSGKDIAYKPNTYQEKTVPNTQGANYLQLREWTLPQGAAGNKWWTITNPLYIFDTTAYNFFKYFRTPDGDYADHGNTRGGALVSKVNDGMITNYPYDIPDNFVASNTHGQYWALDIESDSDTDGESDLVVWYTINDLTMSDGNYYTDDLYSVSPYDARNTYYIYNMGNITYTGVGDYFVSSEQEVKLFINTMVASYVASIKNPVIKIVEDATADASEISNMLVPYWEGDVNIARQLNGDTIRVYFTVSDNNIVKGTKTITGNFYLDGVKKKLNVYNSNDVKIYDASSSGDANVFNSGYSYYVELPVDMLISNVGSHEFRIEIYTDWIRNGKAIQSDKVSDSITLSKIELFNLD